MAKEYIVAYPEIQVELEDGTTEKRRVAIGVTLKSGTDHDDAVFQMGEAVSHPDDIFNKKVGRDKAVGRSKSKYAVTFSLEEANAGVVTTPITELPLPYGVINRLPMLIPR